MSYEEQKTTAELKETGKLLQTSNDAFRNQLRARVQDQATQQGHIDEQTLGRSFGWFVPAFSSVVIGVFLFVSATYQPVYYDDGPVFFEEPAYELEEMVLGDMTVSIGLGASDTSSTFRNRFLKQLGRHDVSQGEIDAYRQAHGDLFEEDVRVNLLSKEEDAAQEVQSLFEGLGGFVERVREVRRGTSTITGRILRGQVPLLKDELQTFVGSDDFYLETRSAQNRVADAVVIDEKIQEVKDAILVLEEQLAVEENPDRIKELNAELAQHRAYLNEREGTKEDLMERVDYVDVSIAVSEIDGWWKADSYFDIHRSIAGYETPGFAERLLINVLFVLKQLLVFFSYTFWLVIPLGIWRVRRNRKTSLFAGLD